LNNNRGTVFPLRSVQRSYMQDNWSNNWCLSRSLCWWHLYVCNRPQRGLCSQEAAGRFQCYWDVI
jgi:hypothetical protein